MGKPAARIGDMTAHGGSIVAGCPTVLIGGMPAARLGDMHVCPMVTPAPAPVPHVGGPISLGSAGVLIGGMPAARVGDMATCVGPPDTIALGCFTVLIGEAGGGGGGGGGGGAAAAAKASAYSAIVGEPGPEAEGPHWIDCQFVDSAGNPVTEVEYELTDPGGNVSKGILTGDARIKRGGLPDEGDYTIKLFAVYNAKWSQNEARVGDKVKLSADVEGFEDGTAAKIEIWEQDIGGADDFIKEIEAKVEGGKVEVEWEYEYHEDDDEESEEDKKKGYSAPEYYFFAKVEKQRARSDILEFKDYLEIELLDNDDNPIPNEEYILYLSNGEIRKGKLDGNGYKKEEEVLPGNCDVKFPNIANQLD